MFMAPLDFVVITRCHHRHRNPPRRLHGLLSRFLLLPHPLATTLNSPRWRRALWIALAVNATFSRAEIVAGVAAGSASLQADALGFLATRRTTRSALARQGWR